MSARAPAHHRQLEQPRHMKDSWIRQAYWRTEPARSNSRGLLDGCLRPRQIFPQPGDDYDSFIARTEQAVRTLAGPKGLLRDAPAPTGSGSAEGSNYWY